MTFVMTPTRVLLNPNITPLSKTVYSLLLFFDRGGKSKGCFCKKETLTKYLDVSENTLRKSLTELKEMGFITIQKRKRGQTDLIKVVRVVEKVENPEPDEDDPIVEEVKVEPVAAGSETISSPQNWDTPPSNIEGYTKDYELEEVKVELTFPIVETITSKDLPPPSRPNGRTVGDGIRELYGLRSRKSGEEWRSQQNDDLYGSKCDDPTPFINRFKELLGQRKE